MMGRSSADVVLAATFDPGPDADQVLEILAWCGSAAGVAGIIIVGIQMALQLRRGEPGTNHIRELFFVLGACILVATAGPIVAFLGSLTI